VVALTPSKHQSGEIDRMGAISKCGDAMMRTVLFETAQSVLTRTIEWSWLKGWGMKIARLRGMRQLRPRSQSCWGTELRTGRRWAAEDCSGGSCHPPAFARAGLPHGRERIDGILPARFWLT
jgi:hypothetical protein